MIRNNFIPKNDSVTLSIPQEYIGKEVEITICRKEDIQYGGSLAEHSADAPLHDRITSNKETEKRLTIMNLYI